MTDLAGYVLPRCVPDRSSGGSGAGTVRPEWWGGLGDGVAAGWIVRRQRACARKCSPASGALAGIAKTAGQEWANVHCKAIDLDHAFDSPETAAGLIVDEMLRRGPAEVGLTQQGRTVLKLEPLPEARLSRSAGPAPRAGRCRRDQRRRSRDHRRGCRRPGRVISASAGRPRPQPGPGPGSRLACRDSRRIRAQASPAGTVRSFSNSRQSWANKRDRSWPSAKSVAPWRGSTRPARRSSIARSTCGTEPRCGRCSSRFAENSERSEA